MIYRLAAIAGSIAALIAMQCTVVQAAAPTFIIDPANAASGIAISRITVIDVGGGSSECVFFINTAAHAATRISFAFETLDDSGKVTQTDAFDRRGTVTPGVNNDGLENARQLFSGSAHGRLANCRDTYQRRDGFHLRVRVVSATFDDGSVWLAPIATPSTAPVAAPTS